MSMCRYRSDNPKTLRYLYIAAVALLPLQTPQGPRIPRLDDSNDGLLLLRDAGT